MSDSLLLFCHQLARMGTAVDSLFFYSNVQFIFKQKFLIASFLFVIVVSISYFVITYLFVGDTNWLMVATGVADCYYNVMDLPTGATYRFRVACVNKAGQGPYSNLSEKVVLDSTGAVWFCRNNINYTTTL